MTELDLDPDDCEGVYLEDDVYDELVNELAERGSRLETRFRGDGGPTQAWLDASGQLWIAPWSLNGRAVRAVSASRAAADPSLQLPQREWPSTVLHRRLVAGGVSETKATELVHKLYAKRDCRHVFDDAFVTRIIEQNR